ncbi:hypothetical protein [Streptomyces sp. RB17]|uniref:hypothetical protein n=1 Tax=Streptomyces sp. RB17 TaxID=2585197 RepID=UPI00188658BD|nr:hypothetical protein [Streptomyces sp. RB17]
MDFVFTVTSAGPDRVAEVLRRLMDAAPQGSLRVVDGPDGVGFQVSGEGDSAARIAVLLIVWWTTVGSAGPPVTISVDVPGGGRQVMTTSRPSDIDKPLSLIEQLGAAGRGTRRSRRPWETSPRASSAAAGRCSSAGSCRPR